MGVMPGQIGTSVAALHKHDDHADAPRPDNLARHDAGRIGFQRTTVFIGHLSFKHRSIAQNARGGILVPCRPSAFALPSADTRSVCICNPLLRPLHDEDD